LVRSEFRPASLGVLVGLLYQVVARGVLALLWVFLPTEVLLHQLVGRTAFFPELVVVHPLGTARDDVKIYRH
jgi:hypothetical protein